MRQIFQFREVRQFEIKIVYDEPAINRHRQDDDPQDDHEDVVKENQIVDNREKQKCKKSEEQEKSKAPQPGQNLFLVLLQI